MFWNNKKDQKIQQIINILSINKKEIRDILDLESQNSSGNFTDEIETRIKAYNFKLEKTTQILTNTIHMFYPKQEKELIENVIVPLKKTKLFRATLQIKKREEIVDNIIRYLNDSFEKINKAA